MSAHRGKTTHLVAERSVNVPVARLEGVGDSLPDLSGLGLPCAEADSGDGGASVELEGRGGHFDDG